MGFNSGFKVLTLQKTLHKYIFIQGDQKFSVHLTITVNTTDDLKMAITEYIQNVDRAILNTVFESTVRRVHKCL